MLGTVMRGRMGGDDNWARRWALFDDLKLQHQKLGQTIDFAPLKAELDSVFLFDLCAPLANVIRQAIETAKAEVATKLRQKYGPTITDNSGWNADHQTLQAIDSRFDTLFERAKSENIARAILATAETARVALADAFQIAPAYNAAVMARLTELATRLEQRPLAITDTLVAWADDALGRS